MICSELYITVRFMVPEKNSWKYNIIIALDAFKIVESKS